MSNLKDLLDEVFPDSAIFKVKEDEDFETLSFKSAECQHLIFKEKLGLFWERGGKRFCELGYSALISESEFDESQPELKEYIDLAKSYNDNATKEMIENARDFLDCLDCLGEEKVKELLQGVEK